MSFHPQPADEPRNREIASQDHRVPWEALEQLVHLDPSGRGLSSFRQGGAPLDTGQLRAAALHLAEHARAVAIVTGFCVVTEHRVTAETDGPPGALFLARALLAAGVDVVLVSDLYGLPLLKAGCAHWKLDRAALVEFPIHDSASGTEASDRFVESFFSGAAEKRLTHLVAIERPGPSHTLDSLAAQPRGGNSPRELFAATVPPADRDVCHNMRGTNIDGWTARTHRLFDWVADRRGNVTTIGIGDGGNEIGMGRFAWETVVEAVGNEAAGRIASRIATEFALLSGVSDWGAYGLALAFARLRGIDAAARMWNAESSRRLVEHLVAEAGAVDGLTGRATATVDGLPLDVYLRPLVEMQRLLGL